MAQAKLKEGTVVEMEETNKVVYEKKSWLIFSWYVKVYAEKIGKDLVINTVEEYDKIFINGKEVLT